MWNVLLVAIRRWYLPLSIYIINKEIILYLILMWYRLTRRNGRRYQHGLAWYACSVGNNGRLETAEGLVVSAQRDQKRDTMTAQLFSYSQLVFI